MSFEGTIQEDSTFSVMMRIEADGSNAVQADISSITWAIYDADETDATATGTLTVSNVIFDTLQTDGRWSKDDTGYNFRHDVAATVLTDPGTYQIEYKVTFTGGDVSYLEPVRFAVLGVKTV